MVLLGLLILSLFKLCLTKRKKMEYRFKLDSLQKVWYRNYITVEADSEKEAIEKAILLAQEESELGYIDVENSEYTEYLFEAGVIGLKPEENEGNSTVELEYDDQIIWTNEQSKL